MTFTVSTDARLDVVDVTDRVAAAVPDDADGTVTVFVEHTTAGVVINEAEPRLLGDLRTFLSDFVPDEGWEHDRLDGNADSHLRGAVEDDSGRRRRPLARPLAVRPVDRLRRAARADGACRLDEHENGEVEEHHPEHVAGVGDDGNHHVVGVEFEAVGGVRGDDGDEDGEDGQRETAR